MSIRTQENILDFQELASLLVVEKKSLIDDGIIQPTSKKNLGHALYTSSRRGRGRGCSQRGG